MHLKRLVSLNPERTRDLRCERNMTGKHDLRLSQSDLPPNPTDENIYDQSAESSRRSPTSSKASEFRDSCCSCRASQSCRSAETKLGLLVPVPEFPPLLR